ncbi:16242_t:CDS:2 [Funneliformis caledonium]|uniref:16242_t:CDS:1 n=1 Tax=Funneliformis caledonium TaxID=1117310 RepID=A0A9N9CWI2_9GLOM|nr:16242_t:CDS:2 [Funneliformis caledonium]
MSIEQYFKKKISNEDMDEINDNERLKVFKKNGSKKFKTSALSEHTSTKDHTDATNLEISRAEFIRVSNNSIDKAQNHVGSLMKIIFWLAENDISLNKLSEVVKLCRILGCPQLISAFSTINYENNVSGREMLYAISISIEETIWEELIEAIAFGIIVDEINIQLTVNHENNDHKHKLNGFSSERSTLVVAGAILGPIAICGVVKALGFGEVGIAAGSIAAWMVRNSVGIAVAAGSLVAIYNLLALNAIEKLKSFLKGFDLAREVAKDRAKKFEFLVIRDDHEGIEILDQHLTKINGNNCVSSEQSSYVLNLKNP